MFSFDNSYLKEYRHERQYSTGILLLKSFRPRKLNWMEMRPQHRQMFSTLQYRTNSLARMQDVVWLIHRALNGMIQHYSVNRSTSHNCFVNICNDVKNKVTRLLEESADVYKGTKVTVEYLLATSDNLKNTWTENHLKQWINCGTCGILTVGMI